VQKVDEWDEKWEKGEKEEEIAVRWTAEGRQRYMYVEEKRKRRWLESRKSNNWMLSESGEGVKEDVDGMGMGVGEGLLETVML